MDILGSNKSLGTGEKSVRIEKLIALFEKYLRTYAEKLQISRLFNKIEDIFHNDIEIMT